MSETPYIFGHVRAQPGDRPVGGAAHRPGGPLSSAIGALLTWIECYRQRRILYALSDHMLKDIGISRADAEREIGKRFWRA
jgi:uncharacterized protein YjiS (DUF1127 family)